MSQPLRGLQFVAASLQRGAVIPKWGMRALPRITNSKNLIRGAIEGNNAHGDEVDPTTRVMVSLTLSNHEPVLALMRLSAAPTRGKLNEAAFG
jgi:hypothetical protein